MSCPPCGPGAGRRRRTGRSPRSRRWAGTWWSSARRGRARRSPSPYGPPCSTHYPRRPDRAAYRSEPSRREPAAVRSVEQTWRKHSHSNPRSLAHMAEAQKYPVRVNVQDYGAVPDGVTDCSAAFQQAVDALDPHPFLGGGTVYIPAAESFYALSRSVIVDHYRVRIVGESRERSVVQTTSYSPAFTFGLPRGSKQHPLSPDHWVDLHGILDDSAFEGGVGRWGYRTKTDEVCTLSFPASPFAFGPSGANYWQGVGQFTLDFVVRNNAGPWADLQQLFGLVDAAGEPAPWFAQVRVLLTGVVMCFSFRTNDGLYREIRVPMQADQAVLRCSLQLDLGTGAVAAWLGHGQVTPDLSLVNDGWPTPGQPSSTLAFIPNWYSPFNLARLTATSNG